MSESERPWGARDGVHDREHTRPTCPIHRLTDPIHASIHDSPFPSHVIQSSQKHSHEPSLLDERQVTLGRARARVDVIGGMWSLARVWTKIFRYHAVNLPPSASDRPALHHPAQEDADPSKLRREGNRRTVRGRARQPSAKAGDPRDNLHGYRRKYSGCYCNKYDDSSICILIASKGLPKIRSLPFQPL